MKHALTHCSVDFDPGAYFVLYPEHPLRSAMFLDKAVNTMRIFDVDSVIGVIPESDVIFRHHGNGLELVGNNCQISSLRAERDYLYRMTGGLQLVRSSYYDKSGKRLGGVIGHIVLDDLAATRVSDGLGLERAKTLLTMKR
jgi:CMP-N-acetylneuraminic acid synthetase